jgi:membrane fusion protein, multidrug efflux system
LWWFVKINHRLGRHESGPRRQPSAVHFGAASVEALRCRVITRLSRNHEDSTGKALARTTASPQLWADAVLAGGYSPGTEIADSPLKTLHTVVAVLGIALAGTAAWWWQNKSSAPMTATAGAGGPAATGSGPGAAPGAKPGGPGGAGGPGGGQGGPAPVEVAKATAITISDDLQAVGSLKSKQGVMLRPEVSGRIAKLGFVNGQKVSKGQLMVQLDDSLQQAQLQSAMAQLSTAQTNLQRSRELLGQGFVSQSAVDQNVSALAVVNAQVNLANVQLARMKVLAPFDGTTGLRAVDVGDYVKDGADIVNIEDLSALTVRFALPERAIDKLRPGQLVDVTFDALPGRSFKGSVLAVDSQVDANGRAVQVQAQVANPGALLKPGMFARARVVFAVRAGAVVVPEEALVPQGERQLIFKVVPGPNGQSVSQKLPARIGLRLPGKVEILEGIKEGDSVVVAGHTRLLRGDALPLRVIDLSAPPKPAGNPASPAAVSAVSAVDATPRAASSVAASPASGAPVSGAAAMPKP